MIGLCIAIGVLTDQIFRPNLVVVVSEELFYDRNFTDAQDWDISRLTQFRNRVQSNVAGYDFWLMLESVTNLVQASTLAGCLMSAGINFKVRKEVVSIDDANNLCSSANLIYAPRLSSHPRFAHRRITSFLEADDFLQVLISLVIHPSPFSIELFRKLEANISYA